MLESSTHIVKSAQRVLEVIEFFSEDRPAASVTEISRALAYPQSSTSVLLRCLWQLGYLYYDRFNRTYRLSSRAALLGCWAENGNFRGGRTIDMLDAIALRTEETVVLSSGNVDYALHHLHVRSGRTSGAIEVEAGSIEPLLHNVQGELQLASYPDKQVRLALHRLNAEEPDPEKRVNVAETAQRFQEMRDRGWAKGPHARMDGVSAIAVSVPRLRGGDRLVVSVVAQNCVIEEQQLELLRIMIEERDRHFGMAENAVGQVDVAKAPCSAKLPAGEIPSMRRSLQN